MMNFGSTNRKIVETHIHSTGSCNLPPHAIWSGWIRIGWPLPLTQAAGQHGALMIGSFLTTVILLERVVTFKNRLLLLLPFLNGISAIFFLLDKPITARYLLLAGSVGFAGIILNFLYRFRESYYYIFFLGAFCLTAGNVILIKSQFYPMALPWWMGYLLFTIVAERLELSPIFAALEAAKHSAPATLSCLYYRAFLAIP